MIKEKPILFSAAMVRAVLDDFKTQTRRKIKLKTGETFDEKALKGAIQEWRPFYDSVAQKNVGKRPHLIKSPYGLEGDQLWVRETFCDLSKEPGEHDIHYTYKADEDTYHWSKWEPKKGWTPSIHMPRIASRIDLRITGIRVERLHDISEDDCLREGIIGNTVNDRLLYAHHGAWVKTDKGIAVDLALASPSPVNAFRYLWNSINGKDSWNENPWVWVVDFERIRP